MLKIEFSGNYVLKIEHGNFPGIPWEFPGNSHDDSGIQWDEGR